MCIALLEQSKVFTEAFSLQVFVFLAHMSQSLKTSPPSEFPF